MYSLYNISLADRMKPDTIVKHITLIYHTDRETKQSQCWDIRDEKCLKITLVLTDWMAFLSDYFPQLFTHKRL